MPLENAWHDNGNTLAAGMREISQGIHVMRRSVHQTQAPLSPTVPRSAGVQEGIRWR